MACLKVQSVRGIRLIPESSDGNVRGQLRDEVIVGAVMDCGPNSLGYDLNALVTPDGLMVGNLIKKVTNAIGIKQCLSCKGRQQHYNRVGLAVQQKIKDLF